MGYYLLFEVSKYVVRQDMHAMIRNHPAQFTVLSIANPQHDPDFRRIDNREFSYKGALYDIVREIKTAQNTVFICIHDARETRLASGQKKMEQNKLHFALLDHLLMFCLSVQTSELCSTCTGNLTFPPMIISIESSMLPTWSPPPEVS
jgi:hypothetical protein